MRKRRLEDFMTWCATYWLLMIVSREEGMQNTKQLGKRMELTGLVEFPECLKSVRLDLPQEWQKHIPY